MHDLPQGGSWSGEQAPRRRGTQCSMSPGRPASAGEGPRTHSISCNFPIRHMYAQRGYRTSVHRAPLARGAALSATGTWVSGETPEDSTWASGDGSPLWLGDDTWVGGGFINIPGVA